MKIRMFAFLALAFVALSSFSPATKPVPNAVTQQTTSFNFFRTHRQGAGIMLSWSAPTQGVDHFLIEKSYDGGEFFETVTIAAPNPGSNRYRDDAAFGGTIHYRVSAKDAGGNTLFSATDVVRLMRRG